MGADQSQITYQTPVATRQTKLAPLVAATTKLDEQITSLEPSAPVTAKAVMIKEVAIDQQFIQAITGAETATGKAAYTAAGTRMTVDPMAFDIASSRVASALGVKAPSS